MPNCLVSQLDNNVKIGSKVQIADNSDNIYSGYILNLYYHKDGRFKQISLSGAVNSGRYECGILNLFEGDIKDSKYSLIFL
jgi:hypothetical protein